MSAPFYPGQGSSLNANAARKNDYIKRARELLKALLDAFGAVSTVQNEGQLVGYVSIDQATGAVTTTLAPEDFIGENAGIDPQTFAEAVGGMILLVSSVDNALAGKCYQIMA